MTTLPEPSIADMYDWHKRREIAFLALWKVCEQLDVDIGKTMSLSSHYKIFSAALKELNSLGPDPVLAAWGKK